MKLRILLLMAFVSFSVLGCSSSSPSAAEGEQHEASKEDEDAEKLKEKYSFSFDNQVVLDENGITITADYLVFNDTNWDVKFRIKNKTDHDIYVCSENGSLVNGYQIVFGGTANVASGAEDDTFVFYTSSLEEIMIQDVSDIRDFRPVFKIMTKENGSLKDDKRYVGNVLTVSENASVMEPSGTVVYDDKNIKIYYNKFIKDYNEKCSLAQFIVENNNGIEEQVDVGYLFPLKLNGKEFDYNGLADVGDEIVGGAKGFYHIAFYTSVMEEAGISEMESIEGTLTLNRHTYDEFVPSSIEWIEYPFQVSKS